MSKRRSSSKNGKKRPSRIRVCVRKRPLNKDEISRGFADCADSNGAQAVTINEPRLKVDLTKFVQKHQFIFDEAFDKDVPNRVIYEKTCKPLVEFFFAKGRATCFAYGQTGSGKTYTMMGPEGGKREQNGLYVLAAQDIFHLLSRPEYEDIQIWVSFFEIYGGRLFDLLNSRKKLVCREDGDHNVRIVGMKEHNCRSVGQLLQLIAHGNSTRSSGVTGANIDSSRSHAILQICGRNRYSQKLLGKFSFIDLAGSERARDTFGNNAQTRFEGAEINKSLLALKECIRALDQNAIHRPFRGSKLTQVLKDSFLGDSRTVMIATISPSTSCVEHTLNTLRYADRVKEMKEEKKKLTSHNAYMPHRDMGKSTIRAQRKVLSPTQRQGHNETTPRSVREGEKPDLRPGVRRRNLEKSSSPRAHPKRSFVHEDPPLHSNSNARIVDASLQTEDDLDQKAIELMQKHQRICTEILKEEEVTLDHHRQQINDTMLQVKGEMELLKKFDANGVGVHQYVDQLERILFAKINSCQRLREKLSMFKAHLHEERVLGSALNKLKEGRDAVAVNDIDTK